MKTTLNAIRACSPCQTGWKKLLQHVNKTEADDVPLSISTILDSNGFDDALWCLRAVKGYDREIRLYAVWCARRVQHPDINLGVEAALEAAEGYANGVVSVSAMVAARDAVMTKGVAWSGATWSAADVEVGDAAFYAATAAANAIAAVTTKNAAATNAAARAAARDVSATALAEERAAQATELRRICSEVVPA